MFKRLVILGLVAAVGLVAQPAVAGKKGPKPWKSEEVTLGVPHPLFFGQSGSVNAITAKEFENSCAIPSSNGVDGFVFEVPKEYQGIQASVSGIGAGGAYDIDMFMYDANCTVTIASQATGSDEVGLLPKGTAFVFIHNYEGDPNVSAHLELKPYKKPTY
jgi:hypothetical protein